MYVCTVCMNVCMLYLLCMYVFIYVLYVCMYVCKLYLLCIYVCMYVRMYCMYVVCTICITLRRIGQMSQGPGLICMCMYCMYCMYSMYCLNRCNYDYFLPGFRRRVSWNTMHMPSACGHAPFQPHLIFQTRRKN